MGSAILDYIRIKRMSPERRAKEIRALLVVLTFKASLFVLVGVLLLGVKYNISAVCTRVLLWPMVSMCLFLMLIFTLGYNGVIHQQFRLKLLYLVGLCLVIPALLAFVIFGYVAVGGIDLSSVKVREYNLTDYSGWLRDRVADPQYWAAISDCVRDRHACNDAMRKLVRDPETGIFVPEISHRLGASPKPIESGCCKPPSSCAFTYVNGTTWIPTPGASSLETNVDCSRWSNDQQKLCFQCDSCKAGLLDEMKKGWSIAATFPIITLIALIGSCHGQVEAMYTA